MANPELFLIVPTFNVSLACESNFRYFRSLLSSISRFIRMCNRRSTYDRIVVRSIIKRVIENEVIEVVEVIENGKNLTMTKELRKYHFGIEYHTWYYYRINDTIDHEKALIS